MALVGREHVVGVVAPREHDIQNRGQPNLPETGVLLDDRSRFRNFGRGERFGAVSSALDLIEQGDLFVAAA